MTALAVNAFAVQSLARAAAAAKRRVRALQHRLRVRRARRAAVRRDGPGESAQRLRPVEAGRRVAGAARRRRLMCFASRACSAGQPRESSVDRIIAALRSGQEAPVFVDRTVTPSYVEDVAAATWALITSKAPAGVYHSSTAARRRGTTWGGKSRSLLDCPPRLRPVKVTDVPMRAPAASILRAVEREADERGIPDAGVAGRVEST